MSTYNLVSAEQFPDQRILKFILTAPIHACPSEIVLFFVLLTEIVLFSRLANRNRRFSVRLTEIVVFSSCLEKSSFSRLAYRNRRFFVFLTEIVVFSSCLQKSSFSRHTYRNRRFIVLLTEIVSRLCLCFSWEIKR